MKVFIRYHESDEAIAGNCYHVLRSWGYEPWLDRMDIRRDVPRGSPEWTAAEAAGLDESQVVLSLVSPQNRAAPELLAEWDVLLSNQKTLILLLLSEVQERDIPLPYSHVPRVFMDGKWDDFEDLQHKLPLPPNWAKRRQVYGQTDHELVAVLVVYEQHKTSQIELPPQTVSLGREPVDPSLPHIDLSEYGALDKGVSRLHARLRYQDGVHQIEDAGSTNGTYLNGQKVVPEQPRSLRDFDHIRLGRFILEFRMKEKH